MNNYPKRHSSAHGKPRNNRREESGTRRHATGAPDPFTGGKERSTPQAVEAEQSTLGAMLMEGAAAATALEMLEREDFYKEGHRLIFGAMKSRFERGLVCDLITVVEELRGVGQLDQVNGISNGVSYLCHLMESCPSAANVEAYAKIVLDKSVLRSLVLAGQEVQELAYGVTSCEEGETVEDIALSSKKVVELAAMRQESNDFHVLGEMLDEQEIYLAQCENGQRQAMGKPTGFREVDKILMGLQDEALYLVAGRPSMGKAQPLDAKILTPRGFVSMGDIQIGQEIIGSSGLPCRVTGIFPQGEKDVYRVTTSDKCVTECCDEHLWFTTSHKEFRRGSTGSVKALREIRETIHVEGTRLNHQLPVVAPVHFALQEPLLLHPYLLGALIGDGGFGASVILHNSENDVRQKCESLLPESDLMVFDDDGIVCRIKRRVRSKKPSDTKAILERFGLLGAKSYDKFIPERYFFASVDERIELLRGLCDTDGYVIDSGARIEYSTSSKRLAGDITRLARSLGGMVTQSERVATFTQLGERKVGKMSYRLRLYFRNGVVPISSQKHLARWKVSQREYYRSIESVELAGRKECQCITVDADDRLYVTDDFIVTHNSVIAMQMALATAVHANAPTAIFSMEMPYAHVVMRLSSSEANIRARALKQGQLDVDEYERLQEARERIHAAPLYIDDTPGLSSFAIQAKCQKLAAKTGGLGLIVIDYLQLANTGGDASSRHDEVSQIARDFKNLARRMKCPVIALSQLSRAVEQREDKRPMLSDLRDSGSLEAEADVVIFPFRPHYYARNSVEYTEGHSQYHAGGAQVLEEEEAEFIVAKQREGSCGTVKLMFYPDIVRFDNHRDMR